MNSGRCGIGPANFRRRQAIRASRHDDRIFQGWKVAFNDDFLTYKDPGFQRANVYSMILES
jgi:hypothetical protein